MMVPHANLGICSPCTVAPALEGAVGTGDGAAEGCRSAPATAGCRPADIGR